MKVKKLLMLACTVTLLLLLSASTSIAGHLSDGLVAYWAFDDTSDATPDDEAHGNDGTINGAAAYASGSGIAPVAGNVDALTFDGTDDFVDVCHADDLDLTSAYSVSVWVNVTDVPSNVYRPILFRGATDYNDIEVYVQARSNDLIVAHNRDNPLTASFDFVGFADPPVGTLFHLAVTFDGSDVRAYYDGVSAAVTQRSTTVTAPLDTDRGWWIGRVDHAAFGTLPGGSDINLFKGLLDEVRIYDRALTTAEIEALGDYSNFGISLDPASDFNPVGNDHTVTATLDPALSFIPVFFKVTAGPNADNSSTDLTDGAGQAVFMYTGDGGAGVDEIDACIDLDSDGECEPLDGEPTAMAIKEWLDQWVTGGGRINANGPGPGGPPAWTFGGIAGTFDDSTGNPVARGQFQIVGHDSASPCHFVVDSFSVVTPTEVSFEASGDCGDITVTIADNGEPGKNSDTIEVTGPTTFGPDTIDGGNFQIHVEDI